MDKVLAESCEKIHKMCRSLASRARPVRIMEVCGTHTMTIARGGLRELLGPGIKLISGPGCPVCVTDQSYMDQAMHLAKGSVQQVPTRRVPGNAPPPIIATYGDMVRVPGRWGSLAEARAQGADVEVVYSADQAVALAQRRPERQVVFLAVGFETTAPGTALAVRKARELGLANFSVLAAHKMIPPAMQALLSAGDVQVDGFLCPGHVSVILGYLAYEQIAREYGRPCVVAGFDPGQVLEGIAAVMEQLVEGKSAAQTVYPSVSAGGNPTARKLLDEVFRPVDAAWRALGVIPQSGMALRDEYAEFDAEKRYALPPADAYEMPGCHCGDVICGRMEPAECELFAKRCTPRDPVGPCMVSTEGACAAAYKYERGRQ
jgi:hydrogenase expression/formation protein HypD